MFRFYQKAKLITFLVILSLLFVQIQSLKSATEVTINATVAAICGNGATEGEETCDDGNTTSGDGCSNVCLVEGLNNGGGAPGPAAPAAPAVPAQPEPQPQPQPEPAPPVAPEPQPEPVPQPQPGDQEPAPPDQIPDQPADQPAPPNPDGAEPEPGPARGGGAQGPVSNGSVPDNAGGGGPLNFIADVIDSLVSGGQQVVDAVLKFLTGTGSVQPPSASGDQTTKSTVDALRQKVKEYGEKTAQVFSETVKVINEVADNPQVEQVAEQVVAPVVAATVVATVVPSFGSLLWPLLRFLFFQPLLLVGRRKRADWGVVYNSLNKLPIDLAVVRLVDKNTKKVKQSRVTDLQGRFLFICEPGKYILEVTKPGFLFPSNILLQIKSDGRMVDIYHGEFIQVTQKGAVITPNIPLDPVGEKKTPKRIFREKRLRALQHGVSLLGVVLTLLSLYISPVWYMWVFVGLQVVVYLVFHHFVQPKKPKGWGIIYEEDTKKPVGNVIVRLFTKEYNKLVSTQTSDASGRYAFLVGPSEYYLTVEKTGYQSARSEDIKVEEGKQTASILKRDMKLKKAKV